MGPKRPTNPGGIWLRLDHIAYAVSSTDEAIKAFRTLYPTVELYRKEEKSQHVFITYLTNRGERHKIELVEPARNPNPVQHMTKKRDVTLYHVAYRVRDLDKAAEHLLSHGFFLVTKPFKATTSNKLWACHLFNPMCGLIEIIGKRR